MTAVARSTAFPVNTISRPRSASQAPRGARRARSSRRSRPTAVGGRIRGSDSSVSIAPLPGPRYRARPRAAATPRGRMIAVLRRATLRVKRRTPTSSRVSRRYFSPRTTKPWRT
jgi:hypothetical protein